jgi:hypothetical protein
MEKVINLLRMGSQWRIIASGNANQRNNDFLRPAWQMAVRLLAIGNGHRPYIPLTFWYGKGLPRETRQTPPWRYKNFSPWQLEFWAARQRRTVYEMSSKLRVTPHSEKMPARVV